MKKNGLLNPHLNYSIARLGHTDTWAIVDCGFPIPQNVTVIDLSLVAGVPSLVETIQAVLDHVVVEESLIATGTPLEIKKVIPEPVTELSHEELKSLVAGCAFVIRTGEATSFANVMFRSGVAF